MAEWQLDSSDASCLKLSGALTVQGIMAVRHALEKQIDKSKGDVSVDFAGVTRVDSSAMSLWLCCMRRADERNNGRLVATNVPEELRSIAGLVGLSYCFDPS